MNKSEAAAYLPFIQALANGQSVEFSPSEGRSNDWNDRREFDFTASPSCYRIKPEPVMVPLEPEDVPPGSLLRNKNVPWTVVLAVTEVGFVVPSKFTTDVVHPYREAMEDGTEIKRPGEDWKPCCKPAGE